MIGVKEAIPGVTYIPLDKLTEYVAAGELENRTLTEALAGSFKTNAGRVAIASPEGEVTYAQLDDITDRFAAALLQLGMKPLDRVIFQSGNCREVIYTVVGCLKAGLIPVCTLAAHRELEIEYLGRHTDARLHIVQGNDPKFDLPGFALKTKSQIPTMRHVISFLGEKREGILRFEDLIAQPVSAPARQALADVPRDPYQVAVFQLSGGTTGVPKVIPRMQNDYLRNALGSIEAMGLQATDVLFMPMPMMHNAAMICIWLPSLLAGSTFVIPGGMTAETWGEVFSAYRPTFIGMIRALLPRLDEMVTRKLGSLDQVRGAWAPDAARVIRERYGILSFGMFGMSEGLNLYCRADDPEEARDWTIGRPLSRLDEVRLVEPGTERDVAVGDVGEFICRGPYTLRGYYNAPDRNAQAFTADGYYRSGDLMMQREIEGKLYYAFAGRTKDVIDRGGEKINCEEVESAASTHPAISECAVVAMPDPVLGERICAFIVVKSGGIAPGIGELGQHLQTLGMAKFKWPERIEAVDAIPLTKVGKVDKATLRKNIASTLSAEAPVTTPQPS